ncbi:MAG TPA: hypothetical protein DCX25_01025 [Candidatus Pacebacteria bacterium]|nr:MAG: hypothetical protein UX00_C0013G0007 [Microgenomates group bacterium GW2011_GWB1_45_17]KKU23554.1 MAG: hypothetical protein UX36_C0004G0007 [Microgenomates group bacterium GW2011_GWC1_46_15]KKU24273.1 MAG: hypothetical protein UX35_C0002G0007 [Microgenomates group bacterium GW2011_GWA1_46_15]HAV14891.1 hypothetical protein [Candidatus Paceibacterota bacterium]HCR11359.1 hypothetical protein [Candidatus Paceibacterota bacterium]
MTEKIYLLREPDVRRLVGRLRQFFNNDEEKTLAAIIQTLEDNPYATFAEVFRKVSEHRGKGKPHGSAIREGNLPALAAPRTSRRSGGRY